MRRKCRSVAISSLLFVAVALASGCGGSSGGSGGGSGSSDGGDKTIKVGFSSALSGPVASAGQGTDAGVMAYLKMMNDQGGINGYKFTFDEKDSKYDPAVAASVARDLVNDEVDLIVSQGEEPLKATVPITDPQNIPVFSAVTGEILTPPKGQFKNVYGINPSFAGMSAEGAKFILEQLHEKQAGLIYLNNDGETMAKPAFTTYYESHGGKVADVEAVNTTTTDYAPFAQKLKASGADVVYAFILDSQLPGLQKAADAIGYHPKWVTWFQPYSESYLKLAGKLATDVYPTLYATPLTENSDPHVQQYKKAMRKYAPDHVNDPPAEQGWTYGAVIAQAVKTATSGGKQFSADGLNAALKSSIHGQYVGLVKSMTYDDQTHAGPTKTSVYHIQPDGSVKALTPYTTLPESPVKAPPGE